MERGGGGAGDLHEPPQSVHRDIPSKETTPTRKDAEKQREKVGNFGGGRGGKGEEIISKR